MQPRSPHHRGLVLLQLTDHLQFIGRTCRGIREDRRDVYPAPDRRQGRH